MKNKNTDALGIKSSLKFKIYAKGDAPLKEEPPLFITKTTMSEMLGMKPDETLVEALSRIQKPADSRISK